jgi:hypothetical protein
MTFTTNFALPRMKRAPSPDEKQAFIDGHSAARPKPLGRAQREQVAACATFIVAYIARSEHCGHDGYDAQSDVNSFTSSLREHAEAYLRP